MSTSPRALPYELISVGPGSLEPRVRRSLGFFADLEQALRARVEDVLAHLAANDGWLVTAEHLIVGPGPMGPVTAHPCFTEIGVDPATLLLPLPGDVESSRAWLLAAHGLN